MRTADDGRRNRTEDDMADVTHAADSHADHGHSPHLAHHFDTPVQQFDAGKLGMWLFLATEVLLFGGLFCAYTVYRNIHPEIFEAGHVYLDKKWGAINTVVLLVSSFTMAWAVRAAQLSQRVLCIGLLSLTFVGGCGFMTIKYVEYKAKWEHGLLWGTHFKPKHAAEHGAGEAHAAETHEPPAAPAASAPSGTAAAPAAATNAPAPAVGTPDNPEPWKFKPPAAPPAGLAAVSVNASEEEVNRHVRNVHQFFGVYFCMTGLHGLHVLAGMVVILWLIFRSVRGDFSQEYFAPVDLGGLYWHLVDLIWIFLFPLLYLIH